MFLDSRIRIVQFKLKTTKFIYRDLNYRLLILLLFDELYGGSHMKIRISLGYTKKIICIPKKKLRRLIGF